jgi:hypothetical protein
MLGLESDANVQTRVISLVIGIVQLMFENGRVMVGREQGLHPRI